MLFHPAVLLFATVAALLRHLDDMADVSDNHPLADQLVGGFAFAVDLLRYVPGAFYGEVLFPIWAVENYRSTKTDFRGPNHFFR